MITTFKEVSETKTVDFCSLAALNIVVHSLTDNSKANYRNISLVQDQIIHLTQIAFTYAALVLV